MQTQITLSLPPGNLRLGIVEASGIKVKPSSEKYLNQISKDIAPQLKEDFIYPDQMQKGIRGLLKAYGFHPSGRNRPASEFLFKDLINRREFNAINNVVDINNHLSLKYHLPISVLDLDKTGSSLCVRIGLENEEYVFNREGQVLSLKKLLLVARHGEDRSAVGSPIKDSQATKVFAETQKVIVFVYSSINITPIETMNSLLSQFKQLLETEAEARQVETTILDC